MFCARLQGHGAAIVKWNFIENIANKSIPSISIIPGCNKNIFSKFFMNLFIYPQKL